VVIPHSEFIENTVRPGLCSSGYAASSVLKEQASRTQSAASAQWLACPTHKGGEIEDSPIEFLGPFPRDDIMCQLLQVGITADICELSRPKESFQDARHVHIQERFRSILSEEKYRIRDVLAHAGQLLYFLPRAWKPAATARHLSCQLLDGRGSPFPEAEGLENGPKICFLGRRKDRPRRKLSYEAGENSRHHLSARALKKTFGDHIVVIRCGFPSPREISRLLQEPITYSCPEPSATCPLHKDERVFA
jgi:hypothetical protein